MFAIVYVALGRTKGTLWQNPPQALAGKVAAMSYLPPPPLPPTLTPRQTYVLIPHQWVFARNKIRNADKRLEGVWIIKTTVRFQSLICRFSIAKLEHLEKMFLDVWTLLFIKNDIKNFRHKMYWYKIWRYKIKGHSLKTFSVFVFSCKETSVYFLSTSPWGKGGVKTVLSRTELEKEQPDTCCRKQAESFYRDGLMAPGTSHKSIWPSFS